MTEGLNCACTLPLTWHPTEFNAAERQTLMREAALLLAALNQMEVSHELESTENHRLERVEAKLDLALHLLARVLEPGLAAPARDLVLSPRSLEWSEELAPIPGTSLLLELRPSAALPLTLRLPAVAIVAVPGFACASLENLSEALDEAWYQFVFRRHRLAIHARAAA